MEFLSSIADFVTHLDIHLERLAIEYGAWTYWIIFATVFAETGLVVAAFLPGDSLLFAAGAFSGAGHLNIYELVVGIHVAAILGDSCNYWIARKLGHHVLVRWTKLIRPAYVRKASMFYRMHGMKAVMLSRFVPTFRTFVPFVAGLSRMKYLRFLTASIIGTMIWVTVFVMGGYYFGQIQWVRDNFALAILGLALLALVPSSVGFLVSHLRGRQRRFINSVKKKDRQPDVHS
ncbi:VTT domain-containing protein [bacterium]|nr:VTT domain-containing protein [bacterium]